MEQLKEKKNILWVDCAKALAILAVLIDHTSGILYRNKWVVFSSYFSVSLFILVSGYLNYKSNERHNFTYKNSIVYHLRTIVVDYLIATFIYQIVKYHKFDFEVYVNHIIHFNITGPFYYVLLYIQLMLVAFILYKFLKKNNNACIEILVGIVILVFASFFATRSSILKVYGGGGRLLGSTYLFLFYIGMLFSKYGICEKVKNKTFKITMMLISLVCFLLVLILNFKYNINLDKYNIFWHWKNPPGIRLMIMSISIFVFSYNFFSMFSSLKIVSIFSLLGKHSLYIFLYHKLILDFVLKKYVSIGNIIIKRVVYIGLMIILSILIEYVIKFIKESLCKILSN